MKHALKLLLPLSVVIIIGLLSWWGYKSFYKDQVTVSFKTEEVIREDLTSSISASGTVEPEELINVGAQVSGKIMHFGTDADGNPIDYGSYVKAGTLLAQIDDVLYRAALSEAEAKKLQAEANIVSAQANITSAEANITSADAAISQAQSSITSADVSIRQADVAITSYRAAITSAEADCASAQASVTSAEAAVSSADASITSAEAAVRQSEAKLKLATKNFERTRSLSRSNAIAQSEFDSAEAEYTSAQAEYSDAQAALLRANAEKARAQADLASSQASLARASAELERARADLERGTAELERARADRQRAVAELERARADRQRAVAELERARADLKHSQAQLTICEAELVKARRNLDYCRITAPVDGIIIDRRVSVGQTVVSSMSASSIFLMAKDMKKMEVWVSVNEADIGHIKAGMPVEFTIDTFPGQVFHGTVKRVRLNATMSQNVVTYIVEVTTDNSNGQLIPYLTANVKFIRERHHNVLTVSNAAFRFQPDASLIAPEYRDQTFAEGARVIYVLEGEFLRPVEVRTGLSAAGRVELIDPPLKEGDVIVYGATEVSENDAPADGQKNSPFMPKPEQRGVSGGGSAANRARAQGK